MADLLVPLLLLAASAAGLYRKQPVFDLFAEGAAGGLRLLAKIVPTLVVLLTAVSLFRASGAMALLCRLTAPLFRLVGIPPELAPLVLVRPFSGSAALAVGSELMAEYGVSSVIGRTAAVMLGSTETTFYTVSVYFGAAGIRDTRYAIPAAVIADIIGFLASALAVRVFFA